MRHHFYLQLDEKLNTGESYQLATPFGEHTLEFDDRSTFCEAIKVNQEGYFGESNVRYANFGIFLGDLGPRQLENLSDFKVIDQNSGATIFSGDLVYWGDHTDPENDHRNRGSGEHVYRIDLAAVPDGGPYVVSVPGFGISHPFSIGAEATRRISFVHTRGLYHQRCGIALEAPYTKFTRDACHTTVEITDAEPPGFIDARGESMEIHGGYHDAGDFDRRLTHILIPVWMLNVYEAFPGNFVDNQFELPESGNGIPDWLDEALWGTLVWEYLQTEDGAIRAGTEANRHPTYGEVNAATDNLVYRTYREYGHTTAVGSGLFAHAARLLEPFDPARADSLLKRARRAWDYLQIHDMPTARPAQKMYAALELYLATEEQAYHDAFIEHAEFLLGGSGWPQQFHQIWWNLNTIRDGMFFAPYFFGYLTTDLPVDQKIVDGLRQLLKNKADRGIQVLNNQPYPLGDAQGLAWGTATNQGRYAEPMMLMYRLTQDQTYLDAVSQLADYALGLNPLGKSYVTGLGENPPNNPLQLDSYFTHERGLGNVPGLVVYGPVENPGGADWERAVWENVYPAWQDLPQQRRYTDGWSLIGANEFTTWETMALNVCMHGFLNSFYEPDTTPSRVEGKTRQEAPIDFELGQNYPNPFNPTTSIEYTLYKPADVKLMIFNNRGRRVRQLEKSYQPPGSYQVVWDGKNDAGQAVSSGIYFYQLETPYFCVRRKMVFVQ